MACRIVQKRIRLLRMSSKTDNHNIDAKLALRRACLKVGAPIKVLDCFSGSEAIWRILRNEYDVTEYLALDVKRKKNRLKIDSLKVLTGQTWTHDVIDLDAYGSPWAHWHEVLKSDRHKQLTVFLTIGSAVFGRLSGFAIKSMGIPGETPAGMHKQLNKKSLSYCLAECYKYAWIVEEAKEAPNPGGSARYIGLNLKKIIQ